MTLKTLALVALTSSDRAQTLESIDIEHSEVSEEGIFFPIYTLLKSSRRNRPIRVVKCIRFDDPSLDVCNYVMVYLQKTLKYRISTVNKGRPKPKQLFLSYSSGKPLSRATIAKYLLDVLTLAGIDTNTFKAHSYRENLPSNMAKHNASPGNNSSPG